MSRIDSPKTVLAHPGDDITDDELWSYIGTRLDRSYDWTAILQGDMSERVRDVISPRTATANSTLAYRNGEFANLEHEIMAQPKTEENVAKLRAARAAHREWRSKMIRFKTMLEERQSEARRAAEAHRRTRHEESVAEGRTSDRTALRSLTFAVLEHEEACRESGRAASVEDKRLWAILDDIRITYRQSLSTLADMADGVWYEEG